MNFSSKLRSLTSKRTEKSASGKPAYCKVPVPATTDEKGKKHYGSFKVKKDVAESARRVVSRLISD